MHVCECMYIYAYSSNTLYWKIKASQLRVSGFNWSSASSLHMTVGEKKLSFLEFQFVPPHDENYVSHKFRFPVNSVKRWMASHSLY